MAAMILLLMKNSPSEFSDPRSDCGFQAHSVPPSVSAISSFTSGSAVGFSLEIAAVLLEL